jgi:hemerythrin-like metal-binding protein
LVKRTSGERAIDSYLPPLLLIGVPSIDQEHEELLYLLVRLSHNPNANLRPEEISETLTGLGEQLGWHFRSEERIFGSCGMPRADVLRHVRAHHEIIEHCAQLNVDILGGKAVVVADVAQLLKVWIVDHLLEHDVKIQKYVTAQPRAGSPQAWRHLPASLSPGDRPLH